MAAASASGTTISAMQLSWIVAGLRALDADVDGILSRVGITEAQLGEPDARFDPTLEYALWEAAIESTGDHCLGLHMARALRPGSFGTVDYMLRNGETLRESLHRAQQFMPLVDPRFTMVARATSDREWIRIDRDGGFPQPDVECLFATIVMIVEAKLPGHQPTQIRLVNKRRGPLEVYEEFFPCEVEFGADHNEMCFATDSLDAPLRRVDVTLGKVLEQHAIRMLEELPASDPFLQKARRALLSDMSAGGPSLDALASKLAVSTRTLRRRLHDHDTSYKELLDSLRRELGVRYVGNSDHGFEEVAALLGYQDSRTFYRNFKRWTGMTPAAYRRQN